MGENIELYRNVGIFIQVIESFKIRNGSHTLISLLLTRIIEKEQGAIGRFLSVFLRIQLHHLAPVHVCKATLGRTRDYQYTV